MTKKNTDNLKIWNALSETDPKFTKNFKRAGGFSGTAQNPTYAIRKMTELFGACGKGWGIDKPEFTIHDAGENGTLVYCTISMWYVQDGERCLTWGVGGDMVVTKSSYGLRADDEAFKKATTDAMTNAMKTIGVAADLHLGMFDDSKYVNDLRQRIEDENKPAPFTDDEMNAIEQELKDAETIDDFHNIRDKARSAVKRMTKAQVSVVKKMMETAEVKFTTKGK